LGQSAQLAAEFTSAQIRGFQRAGIAATVKHFPGLGNTVIDTHVALAKVSGSLDYLHQQDLLPFRRALADDVASVMVTHVMFEAMDNRYPASMSPGVVKGLLREEMGYRGAVCSDCMEMKAITTGWGAGEAAVLSVLAGVDMPLYSHSRKSQSAAYDALLAAAESGRIPLARIDESVARIQALIRRTDLHTRPPLDVVDCSEHRALSQKAARAGTVLIGDKDILPIRPDTSGVACIEFAPQRASSAVDTSSSSAFSRLLRRRLPLVNCRAVNKMRAAASIASELGDPEILILATRSAHLSRRQLQCAQSLIDGRRQVILIPLRNPYDATALVGADAIICTNGDSTPSLRAAVDAICGDYTPAGKLTVSLG
jgi:beta-N-acetylhexosaminidase